MLPIGSVPEIYRAGAWALRRNAGVALAWLVLYAAYAEAYQFWMFRMFTGELHGLGSLLFLATAHGARALIVAILIVPLHASLLSGGRVAGFRALADAAPVCRVAWRSFVILACASVVYGMIFSAADLLLDDMLLRVTYDYWWGWSDRVAMAIGIAAQLLALVFFGVAVILLGLGIPRAVALGRAGPLEGSIRLGARQFRPMAGRLIAGPGAVLVAYNAVVFWGLDALAMAYPDAMMTWGLRAVDLADYAVYGFSAAMTAVVLSDAYRRAEAGAS